MLPLSKFAKKGWGKVREMEGELKKRGKYGRRKKKKGTRDRGKEDRGNSSEGIVTFLKAIYRLESFC